jgi:hypothetical protein
VRCQQGLYSAVFFGRRCNIVVHLSLTDDGLLYCRYGQTARQTTPGYAGRHLKDP